MQKIEIKNSDLTQGRQITIEGKMKTFKSGENEIQIGTGVETFIISTPVKGRWAPIVSPTTHRPIGLRFKEATAPVVINFKY